MDCPLLFAGACWVRAVNRAAFFLWGADTRRARRGAWRIPERTLFLAALLGGGAGAVLGMRLFHHKTRHWYFRLGLPAVLLVQLALGLWWAQIAFS